MHLNIPTSVAAAHGNRPIITPDLIGDLSLEDGHKETNTRRLSFRLASELETFLELDKLLRPKQAEALQALAEALATEKSKNLYLDMPTGSGKTVLFISITKAMAEEGRPRRTLIVVPTLDLVNQTFERFQQFAPEFFNSTSRGDRAVGVYHHATKEIDKPIVITTYHSFSRLVTSGRIEPLDYELLILDEAHEGLSERRQMSANKFRNAIEISFSATPAYNDSKKLKDRSRCAFQLSVAEAVNNDLLSPFRNILLRTEVVDISSVPINTKGEFSEKELEAAVNVAGRNRAFLDMYANWADPKTGKRILGESGIVFCAGVAHAKSIATTYSSELAPYLSADILPCVVVHGGMDLDQRREIFRQHADGRILLLACADLLLRGYDNPRVSVIGNLKPTFSIVDAGQRGGRGLRPAPGKFGYIIDVIDRGFEERNPILFGELVGGAAFYGAFAVQEGSIGSHEQRIHPRVPLLDLPNLKIITEEKDVLEVVKQNVERRNSLNRHLPRKPDGWMTAREMAKEVLRCSPIPIAALYSRLSRLSPTTMLRIDVNINEGGSLKLGEHFGQFVAGSNLSWCASSALVPYFCSCLQLDTERPIQKPSDWRNLTEMTRFLNTRNTTLAPVFNSLAAIPPEQEVMLLLDDAVMSAVRRADVFRRCYADNSKSEFCASPLLVSYLKKQIDWAPKKPEGWYTLDSLASEIGNYRSLKGAFAHFSKLDPDSLFKVATVIGQERSSLQSLMRFCQSGPIKTWCVHPRFVGQLMEYAKILPTRPAGWLSASEVATALSCGRSAAMEAVQRLGAPDKPTTFRWKEVVSGKRCALPRREAILFVRTRSNPGWYVSPKFIPYLMHELDILASPPSGWLPVTTFARRKGFSFEKAIAAFRKLEAMKPDAEISFLHVDKQRSLRVAEHFKRFRLNASGRRAYCVSPQLQSYLEQLHASPPLKSKGWLTAGQAATKLRIKRNGIDALFRDLSKLPPDTHVEFTGPSNKRVSLRVNENLHNARTRTRSTLCCSPRLLPYIVEKLGISPTAPRGWLSITDASRTLKRTRSEVRSAFEALADFDEKESIKLQIGDGRMIPINIGENFGRYKRGARTTLFASPLILRYVQHVLQGATA